jgi:hypothetical protein
MICTYFCSSLPDSGDWYSITRPSLSLHIDSVAHGRPAGVQVLCIYVGIATRTNGPPQRLPTRRPCNQPLTTRAHRHSPIRPRSLPSAPTARCCLTTAAPGFQQRARRLLPLSPAPRRNVSKRPRRRQGPRRISGRPGRGGRMVGQPGAPKLPPHVADSAPTGFSSSTPRETPSRCWPAVPAVPQMLAELLPSTTRPHRSTASCYTDGARSS